VAVLRPRSRAGIVGSLGCFGSLLFIGVLFVRPTVSGLLAGAIAFALYRGLAVRGLMCSHARNGRWLARVGQHEAAAHAFARSRTRWERWSLVDRYRGLLLGTASAHRLAHMARYNQIVCMLTQDRQTEAMALLSGLLEDAPHMAPAVALAQRLGHHPPMDSEQWFEE